MHREALQWVVRHAPSGPLRVLDLGGRNINGSVRDVWDSAASFTVLDIEPGPGVDIVADAGDWMPDPDARFDVVTCCEVFEHTDRMIAICRTAWRACVSGGRFIVTCAGPGRAPHSGADGGSPRAGEYYRNVPPHELRGALLLSGWGDITVDQFGEDVRAVAVKP
jgi:SAM-dependent methyltransferase